MEFLELKQQEAVEEIRQLLLWLSPCIMLWNYPIERCDYNGKYKDDASRAH